MNKAWFFGDSFSYGTGCTPNSTYYENYPLERKKLWTELISEEFGYKMVNKGIEGAGSPIILSCICETLPKIKKNDLAVISGSLVNRLPLVNLLSNKPPFIESVHTGLLSNLPQEGRDPKTLTKKHFNDKDQELNFLKFISYNITPYIEDWEQYYRQQFHGIVKFLNSVGIEAYYWDHRIWDTRTGLHEHEEIADLNKPDTKDGHWSWNGHASFAKYLSNRIKNKEFIDTLWFN